MKFLLAWIIGCLTLVSALVGLQREAHANEHFNMMWIYYQFNDEFNKGRMTSEITIGVPETDNRLGRITCFAGSTAGLPQMELAANTYDMPAGAPIDVEFFTDAGPMLLAGVVKAPLSEEDYAGVVLRLELDHPLWAILERMPEISYRVNGQQISMPLRGSRKSLTFYRADCGEYHNVAGTSGTGLQPDPQLPPQTPSNQPTNASQDPRWATCDIYGREISRNSDVPVTVTFVNNTDGHRGVLWIGFDGVPKDYAALNPGESFTIQTFLTHPWMFTDGPGNCLEMFMPQLGVSQFNVTAPNRFFGDE